MIRAEEHLSNTPRQIFIAQALGYPLPEYAHLPFVAEPGSKNKLSKRKIAKYLKNPDFKKVYEHGQAIADGLGLTTAAETFNPGDRRFLRAGRLSARRDPQLPGAARLVARGRKTEFFTRQQMIDQFSLERVNKAPASFDAKKLFAFQERYMQRLPLAEKLELVLPYLREGRPGPTPARHEPKRGRRSSQAAGDRIKVAGDILDYADFFLADDQLSYDEEALDKHLRKPSEAADLLRKFAAVAGDGRAVRRRRTLERLREGFRPGGGHPARPDQFTLARGDDRQGDRFRAVRDAGDPGPREMPGSGSSGHYQS